MQHRRSLCCATTHHPDLTNPERAKLATSCRTLQGTAWKLPIMPRPSGRGMAARVLRRTSWSARSARPASSEGERRALHTRLRYAQPIPMTRSRNGINGAPLRARTICLNPAKRSPKGCPEPRRGSVLPSEARLGTNSVCGACRRRSAGEPTAGAAEGSDLSEGRRAERALLRARASGAALRPMHPERAPTN